MRNITHSLRRAARRGFTLVEIMLVMVVSGVMLYALLNGYWHVVSQQKINETERRIELIKREIAVYATRNKTATRDFRVTVGTAPDTEVRIFTVPAGRPYLPCPDVSGDGIEDRVPVLDYAPVVLEYSDLTAERAGFANAAGTIVPAQTFLETSTVFRGLCMASRGVVPWQTLGTPETDAWGNRFTYRVQPIYAHAGRGFDQNTKALNVDGSFALDTDTNVVLATVLERGVFRETMVTNVMFSVAAWHANLHAELPEEITVSATADPDMNVLTVDFSNWGNRNIYFSPNVVCTLPPCPPLDRADDNFQLRAPDMYDGRIVEGNIEADNFNEEIPDLVDTDGVPGGIFTTFDNLKKPKLSGVPVVIVSHGKNGYGAVRGGIDYADLVQCKPFPADTVYGGSSAADGVPAAQQTQFRDNERNSADSERINAYFENGENSDCQNITQPDQHTNNRRIEWSFITGITGTGSSLSQFGFDDIVGWISAEDLIAELSALGALPAEPLPLINDQGY